MKTIEVEDELYQYIASQTQHIGESASDILRRLLFQQANTALTPPVPSKPEPQVTPQPQAVTPPAPAAAKAADYYADERPPMAQLINHSVLAKQKGVVGKFIYILQRLHKTQPKRFYEVLSIRGPSRVYFAMSKEALLAAGSSTNPKQIPDSPYWVVTNNTTDKKREMVTSVCRKLGYGAKTTESIADLLGHSVKKKQNSKTQ